MSEAASPLDEAFSDPVRAKEMYFHRCALAHEREDELRAENARLVRRQQELEEALRELMKEVRRPKSPTENGYISLIPIDVYDRARAVLDRKGNET